MWSAIAILTSSISSQTNLKSKNKITSHAMIRLFHTSWTQILQKRIKSHWSPLDYTVSWDKKNQIDKNAFEVDVQCIRISRLLLFFLNCFASISLFLCIQNTPESCSLSKIYIANCLLRFLQWTNRTFVPCMTVMRSLSQHLSGSITILLWLNFIYNT